MCCNEVTSFALVQLFVTDSRHHLQPGLSIIHLYFVGALKGVLRFIRNVLSRMSCNDKAVELL